MRTPVAIISLTLWAVIAVDAMSGDRRNEHRHREEVQRSVEKGLFFVQQTAVRWWKERKCASCHDGPMLLFSHNIAKRQGFPIDQKKLDFWTDRWILVDGLVHKRKDGRKDAGGMLSAPITMLFRDMARDKDPQRAKKLGKLVQIAGSEWQADDGSWKVGSKLNYAPWIGLALESIARSEMPLDDRVRAEILDRSQRTHAWIAKSANDGFPERTENVASWMVYEHRKGNRDRARKLLDDLRRRRREDGTWGITVQSESGHLIVTGAVLFALTSIGLETTDPLVESTQRLLLEKQKDDGRWEEGGRIFDDGSDKENPVFNLWATALICAGLSQTIELPEGTKPAFTPDPEQLAAVNKMATEAGNGYTGTEADPVDKDFSDEPDPDSSDDRKQNIEPAGYENASHSP